jgi:predicted DNA-binding transcriptional regulator AlpA
MKDENTTCEVSFLTVKKVAAMLDLSVRQIWRLVAAHQFPEPIRIGHAARWRLSEIETYLGELKGIGPHD